MGLGTADFVVIVVLVGAGCFVCSVGLWIMLRHAASASQRATQSRLDELAGALKALEARIAETGKIQEKPTTAAEIQAPMAATEEAVQRDDEEVTPETLVVIAAAVTAFLGKKVRIRSAKRVAAAREVASAWSQHGRMLIHSSHNPRSRG